jgi:hypothetical protein
VTDRAVQPEAPSTKAGRVLLEQEAYNSRSFPLITVEAIVAIEAEARAASQERPPIDVAHREEVIEAMREAFGLSRELAEDHAIAFMEAYVARLAGGSVASPEPGTDTVAD